MYNHSYLMLLNGLLIEASLSDAQFNTQHLQNAKAFHKTHGWPPLFFQPTAKTFNHVQQ